MSDLNEEWHKLLGQMSSVLGKATSLIDKTPEPEKLDAHAQITYVLAERLTERYKRAWSPEGRREIEERVTRYREHGRALLKGTHEPARCDFCINKQIVDWRFDEWRRNERGES